MREPRANLPSIVNYPRQRKSQRYDIINIIYLMNAVF